MNILPIGSIVKLKDSEYKLMITARTPLVQEKGITGYFDYSACMYPNGQTSTRSYFFNAEQIEEVCFEGYVDELELAYRQEYEKRIESIEYPRFKLVGDELMVKERLL